ncbi:MAG: T9SS type A sorting domain-containing protein [bacterium]|nr:MAG: T9SS type A sorting domain-containing protein [bacterium]
MGKIYAFGAIVTKVVEIDMPAGFNLYQNHPNPFNPITNIIYELPIDCHVNLEIYNIIGQNITTVVNEYQEAGRKIACWNGMNENGMKVSSGVYCYRLDAGAFTATKKMVLMR